MERAFAAAVLSEMLKDGDDRSAAAMSRVLKQRFPDANAFMESLRHEEMIYNNHAITAALIRYVNALYAMD